MKFLAGLKFEKRDEVGKIQRMYKKQRYEMESHKNLSNARQRMFHVEHKTNYYTNTEAIILFKKSQVKRTKGDLQG